MCHTSTRSVAVARSQQVRTRTVSHQHHTFMDEVRDGGMRPTSSGGPFYKDLMITTVLAHWHSLQHRTPRLHIYMQCMGPHPRNNGCTEVGVLSICLIPEPQAQASCVQRLESSMHSCKTQPIICCGLCSGL